MKTLIFTSILKIATFEKNNNIAAVSTNWINGRWEVLFNEKDLQKLSSAVVS